MYGGGAPILHFHLRRHKRLRLRLRFAVLLFILTTFITTLLQRGSKPGDSRNELYSAADLHLTESAAYDFLHTAEFAQRTLKYFNDDKKTVKFLIEKCLIPPVFVSRLDKDGRRRLLAQLTRESNGFPFWGNIPKVLVVDLQNGLGNRLRALASAMQFAFLTRRILVVIWAPDAHIRARLPELLDASVLSNLILIEKAVPWPLKENQLTGLKSGADSVSSIKASHRAASSFVYYNFMQKDEGFQNVTDRNIRNSHSRHIYVKTAYLIESKDLGNRLLNVFLQSLKPGPRVMQLVHSVEQQVGGAHILRKMVGVHVRGRSITDDNNEVDSDCEYSLEGAQITDKWRKMSTPKQFIPEMKRIHTEWPAIVKGSDGLGLTPVSTPQSGDFETSLEESRIDITPVEVPPIPKFFVSVDSVHTFDELSTEFPKDSLFSLPRKCDDRSAECIVYAFADLVLLSRTGAMLVSGWSSFSEVAMRMRVRPPRIHPNSDEGYYVRRSGHDFGKPSYWAKLASRIGRLLKTWSRQLDSERGVTQEEQLKLCNQKHSKSTAK